MYPRVIASTIVIFLLAVMLGVASDGADLQIVTSARVSASVDSADDVKRLTILHPSAIQAAAVEILCATEVLLQADSIRPVSFRRAAGAHATGVLLL